MTDYADDYWNDPLFDPSAEPMGVYPEIGNPAVTPQWDLLVADGMSQEDADSLRRMHERYVAKELQVRGIEKTPSSWVVMLGAARAKRAVSAFTTGPDGRGLFDRKKNAVLGPDELDVSGACSSRVARALVRKSLGALARSPLSLGG
jgi:hypothetical protein